MHVKTELSKGNGTKEETRRVCYLELDREKNRHAAFHGACSSLFVCSTSIVVIRECYSAPGWAALHEDDNVGLTFTNRKWIIACQWWCDWPFLFDRTFPGLWQSLGKERKKGTWEELASPCFVWLLIVYSRAPRWADDIAYCTISWGRF